MRITSLLLTFIFILNSMPLAAVASTATKTDNLVVKLSNLSKSFEKTCVPAKVTNVEAHFIANGMSESCWKMITEINHLEKELAGLHPQLANTVNCATGNCIKATTPLIDLPSLPMPEMSCSNAVRERNLKNCPGDLACSLVSTVTTIPILNQSVISPQKLMPAGLNPKSCSANDSCTTQVITAFYNSIMNFFGNAWDMLKKAGGFAKNQVGEFWNWVTDAEDSSSAAQLAMARASEDESLFRMLKDDFAGTLSKIWAGLVTGIKEWLKNDILCEKWQKTPHRSKCLSPAKGFDCVSCKSMVNGICAISGVFISEILPAFITGGLTTAAKHGAGAAVRLYKTTFKVSDATIKTIKNSRTLKASLGIMAHLDKGAKVGAVLSKINQYFISPARKVAKISFNALSALVRNSKSYMAVTAKGKYIVFAQDGLKMAGKIALYPIENNMTILAFKSGQRTFDKALKVAIPTLANQTSVAKVVTAHSPVLDSLLTKIEIGHIRNSKTLELEHQQVKLLEGKRKVLTQKALGAKNPQFSEIIRTIYPELSYGQLAKNVSPSDILKREKELYQHITQIKNPELKKSMLKKYQGLIVESKQRKAILKDKPSYKEVVDNSHLGIITRGARGIQLVGRLPAGLEQRKKLEAGIRAASAAGWSKKKKILTSSGFSEKEAQRLMEHGIVGIPPN